MKKLTLLALTLSLALLLISCGQKLELVGEDYTVGGRFNFTFDRPAEWDFSESDSSLLYFNEDDTIRLEVLFAFYDTSLTTDEAFAEYMEGFVNDGFEITAKPMLKMDSGKKYYCAEMTHIAEGLRYYDVVAFENDVAFVYSFGAKDEKIFKANFSKFLPILKTFNVVSIDA